MGERGDDCIVPSNVLLADFSLVFSLPSLSLRKVVPRVVQYIDRYEEAGGGATQVSR